MRAALATAVALLLGAARAADAPVPQGMRGKYKGTVYQQYGTADPKNPQSFECVPADASTKGGSMSASNVDLQLDANKINFGAYKASEKTIGNAEYGMGARSAMLYEWAEFSGSGSTGGIVKLRVPGSKTIVCKYARYNKGQIVFVTLGGSAYSWEDQCSLAAYQAIPNFESSAYCVPVSGTNRAPLRSTTLEVYSGKSGSKSGGSRALVAFSGLAIAIGAPLLLA